MGDIGHCKEGEYYVVGREKALIKARRWQVAPAEIEAVLLIHPNALALPSLASLTKNTLES